MDKLKNPSSYNASQCQNRSPHNNSCYSQNFDRENTPCSNGSFHSTLKRNSWQVDSRGQTTPAANTYTSPRLLPLISKFEALDASSLAFSIRDAQPPHLRIPGSRMGRRNVREDLYQMKTARERLLTLFERPGWGAETLRGLRDSHRNRRLDDTTTEQRRRPSRIQNKVEADLDGSPVVQSGNDRALFKSRTGDRRQSMVKDRIRLFDSGMESSTSNHNSAWKSSGAENPIFYKPPHAYRATVSSNKQNSCLISQRQVGHETFIPKISHGYLRPNETTPRPWRPLDVRRWAGVATTIIGPETPNLRGRFRERGEYSLVSPTPTNALKKVRIIYQDGKRNISERVTVQGDASRSIEKKQGNLKKDVKRYTYDVPTPLPLTRSDHKATIMEEIVPSCNRRFPLEKDEAAFLESLEPSKEKRIQDRIRLFSDKEASMKSLGVSLSEMRIQSTPTKLPSQPCYSVPTTSTTKLPYFNCSTKPQLAKLFTEVTAVRVPENVGACVQLEQVDDRHSSKLSVQEPQMQALRPRKSSGVSDKIQRFEAFARSQMPSSGTIIVEKSKKGAALQSNRVQTWPIQVTGSVLNEIDIGKKVMNLGCNGEEYNSFTPSAKPELREVDMEEMNRINQDKQKAKYKIHSRQERLSRRSRSRSRSAPSNLIPEPPHESDSDSDACKRASEHSRGKRTRSKRKAAKAIEIAVEIVSSNTNSHVRDGGHGTTKEIWIEGSKACPLEEETVVVDTVVAQCELAEPRPLRLAETLRMIKLCRGRFGERSGTWRRKVGRSSEKGTGLAV